MKKRDIILTIVLVITIFIFIILSGMTLNTLKTYASSEKYLNSTLKILELNEEMIFSIKKITFFSSCNANIDTNSNSSFKISDLYQYTDIAIFLDPGNKELSAKNTLKSVSLSNINFSLKPSIGSPNLYYKNINDFAKPNFSSENIIDKSITFEATSENTLDYAKPILFNNCANPITLCYVNSRVEDEFTLSNDISNISHNGSLLKSCGITLNSIACKLSFEISITNNLNEIYTCPITLNIPLSTESNTIYDGNLILEDNTSIYKFIRNQ